MLLFHDLHSKGLVSNLVPIKKKGKIIAQKLLCPSGLSNSNYFNLSKNWSLHGMELNLNF